MILHKTYLLKNSIDVYITELDDDEILMTFHKITTRDRIEILTNSMVAKFIALLNGKNTIGQIYSLLELSPDMDQLNDLINFLFENKLITENTVDDSSSRYNRQEAFFDDLYLSQSGNVSQKILSNKSILFLGCGAYSGAVAEILVRMGIQKVILVDYKKVTSASLSRHLYTRPSDINKYKVDVLELYLQRINSMVDVQKVITLINYDTDLSKIIMNDVDLVVNGLDEPYIGHTSLKLGRYLAPLRIPMYVMGGFDAHLMSSGELIYPPQTPCIDCVQQYFQVALKDWKPFYNLSNSIDYSNDKKGDMSNVTYEDSYNYSHAGGLCSMSNFSAYLSAASIIDFFLSQGNHLTESIMRYEYLLNKGEITKFKVGKRSACEVCNV